jgi:hypothetical protein
VLSTHWVTARTGQTMHLTGQRVGP